MAKEELVKKKEHKDYLKIFIDLIRDQFSYGGKKYALKGNNKKETTDVLFDRFGYTWLLGTIGKYSFRFNNLYRERDLLKIATYCYLIYLKRGFFIQEQGISTAIDTTIELKEKYFKEFIEDFLEYWKNHEKDVKLVSDKIMLVYAILEAWAIAGWESIYKDHVLQIVSLVYGLWVYKFGDKTERDTDTWNEEKKS